MPNFAALRLPRNSNPYGVGTLVDVLTGQRVVAFPKEEKAPGEARPFEDVASALACLKRLVKSSPVKADYMLMQECSDDHIDDRTAMRAAALLAWRGGRLSTKTLAEET